MDDVKCLPNDFTPISKPLKRLPQHFLKKQQQHQEAIDEYHEKKRQLYDRHNRNIKAISEEFNLDVEVKLLDNGVSQIFVNLQKLNQVEDLYEKLQKLEQDKSSDLKTIVQDLYKQLRQINHKLPSEIDELIELELETINQTILANNRHYLDLKTRLQLEFEDHLEETIVQQVPDSECEGPCEPIAKPPEKKKQIKRFQSISKNIGQSLTFPQDPQDWLDELRVCMFSLDKRAKHLMMSYKEAAVFVYHRSFNELRAIGDTLGDIEEENITEEQAYMYTPSLSEIRDQYKEKFEMIQSTWNKLIKKMSKSMDKSIQFLQVMSRLWEMHRKRLDMIKLVVLKDMTNTIQENNMTSNELECQMNVLIDRARQESFRNKMDKINEELQHLATAIELMCTEQYHVEVNILKKYYSLSQLELDVLLSELNRFLTLYAPNPSKDPKIQRRRASQVSQDPDSSDKFIPNQLIYCQYRVEALDNWQYGLWEAINNYSKLAREEANADMNKWIEEQTSKLKTRLKIRLGMHQMQLDKIGVVVMQQRIEEVNMHYLRLEEHCHAVERQMAGVELDSVNESFEQATKKYTIYTNQLYNNAASSQFINQIKIMFPLLEYETKQSLNEVDSIEEQQQAMLNVQQAKIKASHFFYLDSVRMFMEGGNFGVAEVLVVMDTLQKVEQYVDHIVKEINREVKEFKMRYVAQITSTREMMNTAFKVIIKEHTANQEVPRKVKLINNELKQIACKLINQINSLDFDKINQEIQKNLGDFTYFPQFSSHIKTITQKVVDLGSYLMDPNLPTDLPSYRDSKSMVLHLSSHSSLNRLRRRHEELVKDKTREMFNIDLESGTYKSEMMCLLKRHWDDLIQYYRSFFKKHHNCFYLGDDIISTDFRGLIKRIWPLFIEYQHQVETRCLQDLENFLLVACQFQKLFQNTIGCYLNVYTKQSMVDFGTWYGEQWIVPYNNLMVDIRNRFHHLHKRLKPIYGHPNNKWRLDQIKVEADKIKSETSNKLKEMNNIKIKELKKIYNKTRRNYRLLNKKISLLSIGPLTSTLQDFQEKSRMAESCYDKSIPCQYQSLKNLQQHGVEEKKNSIVRKADGFLSELKKTFDEFSLEMECGSCKELLGRLDKEWKGAVKRVLDLYGVKYDRSKLR